MPEVIKDVTYAVIDAFTDMSGSDSKRREAFMEISASIMSFLIAVIIISFVGKWLWNYAMVDLISVAKPAKSIWQLVALMFLISLLLPS